MPKARTLDPVLTPIVIDDVHPRTPGGFPAKAVGGERVPVSAQLVADGHDRLGARVRWRRKGDRSLGVRHRCRPGDDDRWTGSISPAAIGLHELVVDALDRSLRHLAPRDRGEGRRRPGRRARAGGGRAPPRGPRHQGRPAPRRRSACRPPPRACGATSCTLDVRLGVGLADDVAELVDGVPDPRLSSSAAHPLWVDRPARRPRRLVRAVPAQLRRAEGRHRAPAYVADLGFDVVYLPPIHPIGTTHRKGRGNSLAAGPDDPGSPWAIGGPEGGHDAVAPRARHHRRLRRLRRRRRGPRPRGRARLRAPVQPRPPLGPRPSRVVPAPARRLDPLRREPAQEVPGHPPDQVLAGRRGRPRGAVGGVPRRPRALDRPRRPHLPRRQPAHQAAGVLGVAHPRRPRPPPRRALPGRGVHRPRR